MTTETAQLTEEGTSKTVEALGMKIHYHEVGTGDPIVLFHSHGPGTTAVDEAKRLLALERSRELRCYVNLGRQTAMRAFVGEPAEPGAYAELLLREVSYN